MKWFSDDNTQEASLHERHVRPTGSRRSGVGSIVLMAVLMVAAWMEPMHAQVEGQEDEGWTQFVELMADAWADEEGAAMDEELMEDLYELYCRKLNLNDMSAGQLQLLPFLTDAQVEAVMDYVERHRPLLSTGELMAVGELDYETRRMLQLFVVAGEEPKRGGGVAGWMRHMRHDLTVRTDVPLYTRMGFADYPAAVLRDSPNKVYQGSQLYHSLRYDVQASRHVEAGVHGEKDVGERGIDYWGGYVVVRDVGRVEALAVGQYRLSLGMGLAINTASGFGKTMMLSSLGRIDRGIRRHSSMLESGYLDGVAATVRLNAAWRLTAFGSRREVDGTWRSDVKGFSSLKTDGLHRTQLERSKHGNAVKTDWGGQVGWQHGTLQLSATAVHTHLSVPLLPKHDTRASYYRLYNARGQDFTNLSVAYAWRGRRLTMAGETATDGKGGLATINTVRTELGSNQLTLVQRYFTKDYVSLNGKTFSENALPQNECGVYVGWRRNMSRRLRAEAYADVMYFPWLKYQVSQSSWGVDGMAQLTWQNGRSSWSALYRLKSKQRDVKVSLESGTELTEVLFNTVQRARLQHTWTASERLTLHTSANLVANYHADTGNRWGWTLGERISWQTQLVRPRQHARVGEGQLRLSATATYFNTDDYACRIYAYEPCLPYTFGMQAYYYQGLRGTLLLTLPFGHGLSLTTRFVATRYFDRETIGTGLDEIRRNHREDLQLMLRWKR